MACCSCRSSLKRLWLCTSIAAALQCRCCARLVKISGSEAQLSNAGFCSAEGQRWLALTYATRMCTWVCVADFWGREHGWPLQPCRCHGHPCAWQGWQETAVCIRKCRPARPESSAAVAHKDLCTAEAPRHPHHVHGRSESSAVCMSCEPSLPVLRKSKPPSHEAACQLALFVLEGTAVVSPCRRPAAAPDYVTLQANGLVGRCNMLCQLCTGPPQDVAF
eukprot:362504-Chlamydomonas_euryale.AAC.11